MYCSEWVVGRAWCGGGNERSMGVGIGGMGMGMGMGGTAVHRVRCGVTCGLLDSVCIL